VRYRVGHIANPPPPPKIPPSYQVATPGSGATPIAFPSPGNYNVLESADAVHKKGPVTQSIFKSKTKRFQSIVSEKAPGPDLYHPFPKSKFQSFHLNMNQNWM
jgi:hypothetical protein